MKRGGFVFVCLVLSCLAVRAADFGEVSVRVETLLPGNNSSGYQEYRATVVNHSPGQAHRVTLVFPDQSYRLSGNIIRSLTRTVEVAPQATAVVSLFQPPLALAGAGIRVLIDDQAQDASIPFTFGSGGPSYTRGDPVTLVLASPEVSKSKALDYAENVLRKAGDPAPFSTARAELPVTEWSGHWLGYSRYAGVVVTAAEWRALPDAVRQALWRYLECGGVLLVFGGLEVPAHWQATRGELSHEAPPAVETSVKSTSPPVLESEPEATPTPLPPIQVRETLQWYAIGFGQVFVMPAQTQPALTTAQWQTVEAAWQTGPRYPSRPYDTTGTSFEELNNQLPIIERLNTPVRGLFLLMLLFVIVIGPVNLLVLARRQKKLWLLWTVPAISLLTCLAIAAYAIASEGVNGHTRTLSLTLLDEHAHRATTIGLTGFYSPLTPREGLHFSQDTELLPLLPYYGVYSDRGGTPRTLDWSNDQHLSSGWISARVPAWFQIRKSETRRERLPVGTNASGALVVTNGLGAPIRRLWLPDQRRILYEAHDIAPGAQVELKESPRPVSLATLKPFHELIAADWLDEFTGIEEKPEEWLAPGTYLAVLENAPFNEVSLRNVRQTTAKTLVYGIRGK